jgi:peptidoglycan-associated lipoprotein
MKIICAIAAIVILSACQPTRVRAPLNPPTPPASGTSPLYGLHESTPSHAEPRPATEVPHPELVTQPENSLPRIGPKTIDEWNGRLVDVFFDYDQSSLTPDALSALETDAKLVAAVLTDFPTIRVIVEGHCDERGSAEYNLALGDRRASRAAQALRDLGISHAAFQTISYGKEKPQCADPYESCWRKNRRAHFLFREERDGLRE